MNLNCCQGLYVEKMFCSCCICLSHSKRKETDLPQSIRNVLVDFLKNSLSSTIHLLSHHHLYNTPTHFISHVLLDTSIHSLHHQQLPIRSECNSLIEYGVSQRLIWWMKRGCIPKCLIAMSREYNVEEITAVVQCQRDHVCRNSEF